MADFQYSSIFGELTKNVQIRFDAVSKLQKQLFDSVVLEKYLDWDAPTIDLKFEELIGQYNISVAAPTIGDNSMEAILGNNGLQTVSEKVFKHAISKKMTAQEYRKVLMMLDSKYVNDAQKNAELIKTMWGEVTTVVDSVYAKLDLIFLGALSNEGKFTFDANNNPEGGVKGMIDFGQPSANIAQASVKWTAGNIGTVDCFEDIQGILDKAQNKVNLAKILISPAMLAYICRATQTKKMIWGSDKAAKMVMLSDLNEYMQMNGLPVFEVVKRTINIQNGQTVTPTTPFNANNLVFVPDGKLGVIKNAFADNELTPETENGVAYSNYGRIRVSQFKKGETDNSNITEITKAEVNALPVITEFNGIFTLKADY